MIVRDLDLPMATAAELAMVSTRSVLEKVFLIAERPSEVLWSVAVVITSSPSESHVLMEKISSTCEHNVFMSVAINPFSLALVSHRAH